MIVERKPHGIIVSDIIGGYLTTRTYIGYSVKEAKAEFKAEFNL